MLKKMFLLIAGFLVTASVTAFADISSLTNLLAEKRIISYGEAQAIVTESKEEERLKLASGKSELVPAWVQNLSLKGDIRVRTQYDWNSSDKERIRERLRFRIGAETRPVDKITIGFGLATGALKDNADSGASSTNHTFQLMDKANLFIDYAFIGYKPFNWLEVRGGKVKGKTQVWNASDLIWDGDYNPDGLNTTIQTKLSKDAKFIANAGVYTFGETRKEKNMADAYILQPVIEYKNGDIKLKMGLAYQQFNFEGRNQTKLKEASIGDVIYKIINPSLSVSFGNVFGSQLSIFGDMAQNIQSDLPKVDDKDADKGYLAGISFGDSKINGFGKWNIKAMYRYLEEYAIPEKLGDSDAYGGKAGKGYEVVLSLGLTKSLSFGIDYYQMTDIDGNVPKSLCQFDFVCKF